VFEPRRSTRLTSQTAGKKSNNISPNADPHTTLVGVGERVGPALFLPRLVCDPSYSAGPVGVWRESVSKDNH
jgi:hypothetical protein